MEMSSLKAMRKVKASVPLCLVGVSWNSAVSGMGLGATSSVGPPVRDSGLPLSSLKDTRTLIVLSSSSSTRT